MEEASVAGESPDRSKQRESSEDPASGSAGPVPEARAGAEDTEARDPRLSVTRESAGAPGTAAEPRGGVDTATRVLTVPETDGDAETTDGDTGAGGAGSESGTDGASQDADADGAEAEGGEDTGETGGAGQGADGPASDEGRLRDAVAAWIVTADQREAANARREDACEPAADDADAGADTGEAGKTGKTGKADGKAGADGKDSAEDEPAEPAEDTENSKDAEPAEPGADAEPADEPATAEPDKAPGEPAASVEDTGPGTSKPDAEPAADTEPADTADATDATAPDADGATSGEDPEAGDGPDGPSAPAGPAVDQPTAIFRTPASAKSPVDQPTTMLKVGGETGPAEAKTTADEDGAPAEPARGAGKGGATGAGTAVPAPPRPETEAERTSKFVALRHLDGPATPKPPAPPVGAARPPAAGPGTAVPPAVPERTTQQPLPPKPPLDLLAELTNTPPPPETPLRTAVRRVKIWTPLVILLVIVFGVVQSMRPLPAPELDLTARDSFTFEGGKVDIPWPASGQAALDVQGIGTFGSSGAQKPVPIASVAKVMTAYVILREHPLKSGEDGPKIDIDQAAQDQSRAGQESTVDVTAGDAITQREALESILIASANNVARLLARWDAGSEQAFVDKMNETAKDLGMTNTTYTDPSGLNNTTVSTATDQVKLGRAAMREPAFREVAAMMSYDDYKGVNHSNWNQLVGSNDVVGIKTGTTTSALGNLLFAAKKEVGGETRTIVGAVVRQPSGGPENTILSAALDSSDKLIRAAQAALESSTILKKGTVVGYVDDGLGGRTPVVATQDVTAVGWPGLTVKLTFRADDVPHTAPAGTKVGTLTVGDGDSSGAVKVPVALQDDLVEPGFGAKLTRLG
ncbi:D-alanyl-D-alanine carboxypeptidase [Streptomyces sp. NRRL F-5065]|uniref:D-alanyl-D-alanine carboxypeptidase n=1 Tax=Streptomyces sp. NRRL F-5065 TaxID=1463855 RepID=UPI00099D5051|nr:D-alanyl-D-alanine carboxypeptidase [Streptomyces sp. NRRL F-5065]